MKAAAPQQASLFAAANAPLPDGMVYQNGFLDRRAEATWIDAAASLPLKDMNYRGCGVIRLAVHPRSITSRTARRP